MAANKTSFTAGEGGRPKGAQNKTSKQVKEILSDILSDEIEAMPERLNQLSDKDRLDILIKLLPYLLPKQKEIDMSVKNEVNIPPIHWVTTTENKSE
ncbi:MAG: hypothetical protein IPL55_22855 [Saprospiraceae bacterium]|jgi:hypothetical protein|nr:hypothetical protein [Saprospiraceae bacterium]